MKNIKILVMIIFAGSLFLTSACKKDTSAPEDTKPACRPIKMIFGEAKDNIFTLEYGSKGEIIKITNESDNEKYEFYLEYNTDGSLKQAIGYSGSIQNYKIEFKWTSTMLTTTEYEKSSTDNWQQTVKTEYTLNSDGLTTKEESFYYESGTWSSAYHIVYSWTGKNFTGYEFWMDNAKSYASLIQKNSFLGKLRRSNFKSDGIKLSSSIIEYDDKINPFKALGLMWGVEGTTENNPVKETVTSDNTTSTISYTYELNEQGFPTKITLEYAMDSYSFNDYTFIEYDCN